MRSSFLWGFMFIRGKVLRDPHSLGYRMSAVSKSFTRQMGINEFLEDSGENTEQCTVDHTQARDRNSFFSTTFLDTF